MIRWKYSLLIACSVFLLLATSCEKFSGDQTIPSFVSIDSIYLTTDYFSQGTASQRITDAWVSVDNEFIGTFELPARFPVLKAGKHTITVYPGIKKNGIATTRESYPFYAPVSISKMLTPDSTTRMGVLKTTYQSATVFSWMEDFEEAGLTLDTVNGSSAWIQRSTPGTSMTFEGVHSGMIVMDSVHDYIEAQTQQAYTIPMAAVYLEVNFNITTPLIIGANVYGTSSLYQSPVITLRPTDGEWKKIYIDLTTTLNAYSGMQKYRVYIRALKEGDGQQTILLDNLKLITHNSK